VAYRPTANRYRLATPWLLFLPLAVALYIAMIVDSAIRCRLGIGGRWKGCVFSPLHRSGCDKAAQREDYRFISRRAFVHCHEIV
jgi:hypothetical protein